MEQIIETPAQAPLTDEELAALLAKGETPVTITEDEAEPTEADKIV